MLLWNWLRNNSHYLLMLNHCLHSWWWQERWVAVFWFDLNKERGGDRDIAEFNFFFDCSLLGWLQIFSRCKKSVVVSQMQAQNISFYIFNFKMCLFNFENCICTLSVCIGHGSRSRGPTMTKCRVTQPPPQAAANTILQILTHGFPKFKFSNAKFFSGTKGQVMIFWDNGGEAILHPFASLG